MSNTGNTELATGALSHLSDELDLLKGIISRVADELELPTESGNRAHDVLFWLDSPKTDAEKFRANCEKCKLNVEAWPAWKRECMPITPISNEI